MKNGVIAILQDADGRYLVIRRGRTLERAPGWWCFAGGEVEPNEALERALEREVSEELGLCVAAKEKFYESVSPNGVYQLHWFKADLTGPACDLNPHPIEVAEARWLAAADIMQLNPVLPGLIAWLNSTAMP